MIKTIKFVSFGSFWITNKVTTYDFRIQFLFMWVLKILASEEHPQTRAWFQLGFLLIRNSKGVFLIALLRTLFKEFLVFGPSSVVDFVDWLRFVWGAAVLYGTLLFFEVLLGILCILYVLWALFWSTLFLIYCFLPIKKIIKKKNLI